MEPWKKKSMREQDLTLDLCNCTAHCCTTLAKRSPGSWSNERPVVYTIIDDDKKLYTFSISFKNGC